MAGSALNWPTDRYADLIHELTHIEKGFLMQPLKKSRTKRRCKT